MRVPPTLWGRLVMPAVAHRLVHSCLCVELGVGGDGLTIVGAVYLGFAPPPLPPVLIRA